MCISPKIEEVEYLGFFSGGRGDGLSIIFQQSHLGEWHHHSSLVLLTESSTWHRVVHMYKFRFSTLDYLSFYVLICHLYIFFGEVSVHAFYSFLNWLFVVLLFCFESSLHIRDTSPLLKMCFANIFLSLCSLSFHSLNSITGRAKMFDFDGSPIYNFFSFIDCAFRIMSKNSLPIPRFKDFLPSFLLKVSVLNFIFRSKSFLS